MPVSQASSSDWRWPSCLYIAPMNPRSAALPKRIMQLWQNDCLERLTDAVTAKKHAAGDMISVGINGISWFNVSAS